MSFFERLKTAASAEWRAYTEHPFTEGLADGSLTEAARTGRHRHWVHDLKSRGGYLGQTLVTGSPADVIAKSGARITPIQVHGIHSMLCDAGSTRAQP